MQYGTALETQVEMAARSQDKSYYELLPEVEVRDVVDVRPYVVEEILRNGDCYVWSKEMFDLNQTISATVPDVTIAPDLLPSEAGMFHLPVPLAWELDCDESKGVTWYAQITHIGFAVLGVGTTASLQERGIVPGVMFALFARSRRRRGSEPFAVWHWPFGRLASEHSAPKAQRLFQWATSAFLLLNQRVVVAEKEERLPRGTARRLQRAGIENPPAVRVVRLRRKATGGQGEEERQRGEVEWSCQWLVRGHWRQQAHGEDRKQRRPVFILPHMKGPEGKPLKLPAKNLFKVDR